METAVKRFKGPPVVFSEERRYPYIKGLHWGTAYRNICNK